METPASAPKLHAPWPPLAPGWPIDYVVLPERAQGLVEDLNQQYGAGTAIAIEGSIAEEESARQIVDTVVTSFNRPDVLVNNAALESVSPTLDTPLAE